MILPAPRARSMAYWRSWARLEGIAGQYGRRRRGASEGWGFGFRVQGSEINCPARSGATPVAQRSGAPDPLSCRGRRIADGSSARSCSGCYGRQLDLDADDVAVADAVGGDGVGGLVEVGRLPRA